jgi:hypothetical protein
MRIRAASVFETAEACLRQLRSAGRTTARDGREYLVFPVGQTIGE